jgi:hypothetical protein
MVSRTPVALLVTLGVVLSDTSVHLLPFES